MWKVDDLGLATWTCDGSSWQIDARGGKYGIEIGNGRVSLESVGKAAFPSASEQFLRGDQLHVSFPEQSSSAEMETYSIDAVFRPIESRKGRFILEITLSLQTLLLDTYPTLDIVAKGETNVKAPKGLCGPITKATTGNHAIAILLGPHDGPFTANHCSAEELRLRLFGEFLEKGVIRKARPWIALSDPVSKFSDAELERAYADLCESPLPLAS